MKSYLSELSLVGKGGHTDLRYATPSPSSPPACERSSPFFLKTKLEPISKPLATASMIPTTYELKIEFKLATEVPHSGNRAYLEVRADFKGCTCSSRWCFPRCNHYWARGHWMGKMIGREFNVEAWGASKLRIFTRKFTIKRNFSAVCENRQADWQHCTALWRSRVAIYHNASVLWLLSTQYSIVKRSVYLVQASKLDSWPPLVH